MKPTEIQSPTLSRPAERAAALHSSDPTTTVRNYPDHAVAQELDNYQPRPLIEYSTLDRGWSTAFQAFQYGAHGSWDVGFSALHIGRLLNPAIFFEREGVKFEKRVVPSSCVVLPGTSRQGGWADSMKTFHLVVTPEQFRTYTGLELKDGLIEPYYFEDAGGDGRDADVVASLMDAIAVTVRREDALAQVLVDDLISNILLQIVRPAVAESRKIGRGSGRDRLVTEALERIHENITGKLTLVGLADALDVSVQHLSRRFQAAFGISPYQYIIDQRTKLAEVLLVSTDLDLSQIALESGFSSQSQMTTTLRRRTGSTPTQIRGSRH